jgi:hypothetical protein
VREATGNLWHWYENPADRIVITTNHIVKDNGEVVMGKGIALEAKMRDPMLPRVLGRKLVAGGHVVHQLSQYIYSFPTKWDWRKPSVSARI